MIGSVDQHQFQIRDWKCDTLQSITYEVPIKGDTLSLTHPLSLSLSFQITHIASNQSINTRPIISNPNEVRGYSDKNVHWNPYCNLSNETRWKKDREIDNRSTERGQTTYTPQCLVFLLQRERERERESKKMSLLRIRALFNMLPQYVGKNENWENRTEISTQNIRNLTTMLQLLTILHFQRFLLKIITLANMLTVMFGLCSVNRCGWWCIVY